MSKRIMLDTCYGEVLIEQASDGVLECFIGDNYDDFIGSIDGTVYDDEQTLIDKVETLCFVY